ncbi:hypothetical protein F7R05_16585 [Pseudomonas koreensis]|nr:hypothetical protein F7R05_16585 [Pseudomonas koreensis]
MSNLWRGSLLPPGCAAAPKPDTAVPQGNQVHRVATAAQPSGSKLPRHRGIFRFRTLLQINHRSHPN